MKRLLATLILSLMLSLSLMSAPVFAQNETTSFDVFNILNTKEDVTTGEECGDDEECLTQALIREAEEAGTSGVGALLLRAINILTLLIGTFAFVVIIIAGFILASSQGDESAIDRGKSMLNQAILGLVLAFFSYFIVTFIQSFFY